VTARVSTKSTHTHTITGAELNICVTARVSTKSTHAHNNWCRAEYSRDCKSEYEEHTRTHTHTITGAELINYATARVSMKSTHAHNNWCRADQSRDCKSEYEEQTPAAIGAKQVICILSKKHILSQGQINATDARIIPNQE